MTTEQIHRIRTSFAAVERQREVAALVFYRRLFELDPRLRKLFRTDIEEQARKLMDMLALCLSLLEQPDRLIGELEELGARHTGYGVEDRHYATVGRAMMDMLGEVLGREFAPATRRAWEDLYESISCAMRRGAARGVALRPGSGQAH